MTAKTANARAARRKRKFSRGGRAPGAKSSGCRLVLFFVTLLDLSVKPVQPYIQSLQRVAVEAPSRRTRCRLFDRLE